MNSDKFFGDVLDILPTTKSLHARNSYFYDVIDKKLKSTLKNSNLNSNGNGVINFGYFNKINLPYFEMGNINSLDLFGLDELIIFSFYMKNKNYYSKVADIGANIGLHSIIMSKCGWSVDAYEPDPIHQEIFLKNISLNGTMHLVKLNKMAVSDVAGTAEFTRVLQNTTGSHLTGSKENVYGDVDTFKVDVKDIKEIMSSVDFIKMDVEGQEKNIITSTKKSDWKNTDMMVEIGTFENAKKIFDHLNEINVNCFSQKNNWEKVLNISQMPISYKEGSLFISCNDSMNWK